MEKISKMLKKVARGKMSVKEASRYLRDIPFKNIRLRHSGEAGQVVCARLDTHRIIRKGFPEAIYAPGKSLEELRKIAGHFLKMGHPVFITKARRSAFDYLNIKFDNLIFNERAGIIYSCEKKRAPKGKVLVLSAGTSDMPVAEEAALTAELAGCKVERLFDVGVAGIHRVLSNRDKIANADVLIVVAGMEGALASVVGGLTDKPVVACPTSVGYGANFKGVAPLLTMLNCCAPGVAVVNIDNGFGAGYFAALLAK